MNDWLQAEAEQEDNLRVAERRCRAHRPTSIKSSNRWVFRPRCAPKCWPTRPIPAAAAAPTQRSFRRKSTAIWQDRRWRGCSSCSWRSASPIIRRDRRREPDAARTNSSSAICAATVPAIAATSSVTRNWCTGARSATWPSSAPTSCSSRVPNPQQIRSPLIRSPLICSPLIRSPMPSG